MGLKLPGVTCVGAGGDGVGGETGKLAVMGRVVVYSRNAGPAGPSTSLVGESRVTQDSLAAAQYAKKTKRGGKHVLR